MCVVIGFRDVLTYLNERAGGQAVFEVYRLLGEADQAFREEAGIIDSEEDLDKARQIAESFGSRLEPKWPLGYGGRQALVSFYRNTPNITLSIFFKYSRRKGLSWRPLIRWM